MKKTGNVALSGVLCALTLVCLLLTVVDVISLALAALAGILLLPIALECGLKWGFASYAITSLLAILIVPSWECKLLFIFFFGYYPMLKICLNRLSARWLQWGIKFLLFNVAMIVTYALLFSVFHMDVAEFKLFGINFMWGFLAVGNVAFFVFDYALIGIVNLYYIRLHPVIHKLLK